MPNCAFYNIPKRKELEQNQGVRLGKITVVNCTVIYTIFYFDKN